MKAREFNIFEAPLSGISLVEAGAGTGKTYNIASLFVRCILERRLLPANILVLTYTEAATAELKSRLRERLEEVISVLEGNQPHDSFLEEVSDRFTSSDIVYVQEALYKFDEAQISTIHGFCQRLLKEKPIEFGVSPEFEILTDDAELLQDIVDQVWRDFMKPKESGFDRSLQKYIVDENYDPDKFQSFLRPILSKPYAKLLPKGKDLSDYKDDFTNLVKAFENLKRTFFHEEDQIHRTLESEALNKVTYNHHKFKYFNGFKEWLNTGVVPISPVNKLELFGSKMQDKVKKEFKNSFPSFKTNQAVDQYLEQIEHFNTLQASLIQNFYSEVHQRYEQEKKRRSLLTYDDLLQKVQEALVKNDFGLIDNLRIKYPIALIDEFQDTDPIQYSIFKSIYGKGINTAMFMIGDPKQAIYKFRGADIYTYLNAKKDAQQDQIYNLTYNYRSNPQIIEAVNVLFSNIEAPFILENLEFIEAQFPESKNPGESLLTCRGEKVEALQLLGLETESSAINSIRSEVANSTASEVVELLNGEYKIDGKKVHQSDVAILVRKNSHAFELQNILRERGVKSVIRSRESVYESLEAEELYLILKSVLDLSFEDGIRSALATESLGYSADKIFTIQNDQEQWNRIIERFYSLNKLWKSKGFSLMIEELVQLFQIKNNLIKYFDAERRITNLTHLIELLRKAETEKRLSPFGLIRFFKGKRLNPSKNKEDEIVRLESDDKLVQIITVHASKGLEFPIVFCPFLWDSGDGRINYPIEFNEDGTGYFDFGFDEESKKQNKEKYQIEELSESVRLAYVALTRAKSACFVYTLEEGGAGKSALAVLAEGSDKVIGRIKGIKSELDLIQNLKNLSYNSDAIGYRNALLEELVFTSEDKEQKATLATKNFLRKELDKHASIISFSSLSEFASPVSFEEEKPGFDYDEVEAFKTNQESEPLDSFHLRKGAEIGTMLHNILEEVSFNDPETFDKIIKSQMDKSGLSQDWFKVVQKIITDTINHELSKGIRLSELNAKDYFSEIEFHLPTKNISFQKISNSIRGISLSDTNRSVFGFLKGYIDLTFRIGKKYYILDYKSNHLGDSLDDYSGEAIADEIQHSNYDLQYHLYTVALHRMLDKSISKYNYETHFGGVFYLFLRGINVNDPGSGVFFHKPEFEVIDKIDSLFKGVY